MSSPPTTGTTWHEATPTQQGLWILDRIERLRPTYLLPSVVEFTGPVDHALLVASVQRAIARHPALRSRFRLDARLRRVEYRTDAEPAEAGFIDAAADGWTGEELDDLVEVLCYTPFDLAEEAPTRAEVIRVDDRTTLLVLNVHHIVFDGWSRGLLMDEIAAVYQGKLRGEEIELPPAAHPADVLSTPDPDDLAERVADVVERLRGAPMGVALPYDRDPASEDLSLLGADSATHLDADLTKQLVDVATTEGATLYMTGVALLAATLARMGGQRDFLFAVVWPGRDDPATADVVGMFMTTLVVRIGLDETTTWRELLRDARIAAMETFVDADVPLDAIAAALDPNRDVSRPPLTPVLVQLNAVPDGFELAPGVPGRYRPLKPQYSKYDLALFVRLDHSSGAERLELSLDRPADLFEGTTLVDLFAGLRRSAADLARFPEEPVLEPTTAVDGIADDPAARLDTVRALWREVLGVEEVADDVSFFEAGGDSLRLVILVERLNQVSGHALRTVDLFRAGTVRAQAELLAGPAKSTSSTAGSSRERLLEAARARRGEARA